VDGNNQVISFYPVSVKKQYARMDGNFDDIPVRPNDRGPFFLADVRGLVGKHRDCSRIAVQNGGYALLLLLPRDAADFAKWETE